MLRLARNAVLRARTDRTEVDYVVKMIPPSRGVAPSGYVDHFSDAYSYNGYTAKPPRYLLNGKEDGRNAFSVISTGNLLWSSDVGGCFPSYAPLGAADAGASVVPGIPAHSVSVQYLGTVSYHGKAAWHLRVEYVTSRLSSPPDATPTSSRISADVLVSTHSHLPLFFRSAAVGRILGDMDPVEYRAVLHVTFTTFGKPVPRLRLPRSCFQG